MILSELPVMAFLQVLFLALGTVFSLMHRVSSLPSLMQDLKTDTAHTRALQHYLGCHLACWLWSIHSLQTWDSEFALPNVILGVLTLGFAGLIHAWTRTQASASIRYVLLIPVVMLVVWKAFPVTLTAICAATMQLCEFLPGFDHIVKVSKTQEIDRRDTGMSVMGLLRCIAWGCYGLLKTEYCIVTVFAAGCAVNFVDFMVSYRVKGKTYKQSR